MLCCQISSLIMIRFNNRFFIYILQSPVDKNNRNLTDLQYFSCICTVGHDNDSICFHLYQHLNILHLFFCIIPGTAQKHSVTAYGVLILTLIVAVRISRVGAKALFKGLKPVLFIIAFTALLNLFYTPGTELCHFWIFRITIEGVRAAITMMLRITLLIMGTFLLTYTTSPIRLTDGLESLLGPLKKIKVPVHELAMMMSIALRFIPTLIEETDKIMSAQKARGADFETGSLMQRAKALVPLLVPLFVSAFRRADELATAMECRCYHGDEGRTKLNVLHYQTRDYLVLGYYAVLVAAVIALR